MTANLATKLPLHCGDVLNMVDVAMRQEKEFQIDIAGADPIASPLGRIEQNPAFRRGKEIAVSFKNPAAKCLIDHFGRL